MTDDVQLGNEEILTERLAFVDLLAWVAPRPVWQRDALRRLLQNGILVNEDIDDLVELCLDPTLPHEPISDAHISSDDGVGEPITIMRIENPTGINALASDQKLEFATRGLSIVYGDNGSGKSGYVRVLKHACRTRDRNNKILRNVEDVAATPQSANIVFARGATVVDFSWKPDVLGHADLPSVSIFDSRSANIHVEKTNAVAYIPQPMRVLEALATACDQMNTKLDAQLAIIAGKTPLAIKFPQLDADTVAGAFVHKLSANSNVTQLDLLAQLSDIEIRRLAALEVDLAQDPKRAAAKISNQKIRLDEGIVKLRNLLEATSTLAFVARDELKSDWDTKADAAKLASEALFAASPLPDVGKDTWRNLWEAARRYSDMVAYPEKRFPDAMAKDEICVLCQQPLGQDAIDRRVAFETFVKGSTKATEEIAQKAYGDTIHKAAATRISVTALRQLASLLATEIGHTVLAKKVHSCGVRAAWRLRS
ncbi:MAG: hypothetical protein ACREUR_04855, partial [Nitrosospira sp.]